MQWYGQYYVNKSTYLHYYIGFFLYRMDNFYRLAYTLSAHLRNYKMITGSTFLENLIDDKWVNEWLLLPQTPIKQDSVF